MGTFKFNEIAFNSTEKKKPVDEDKYTYLGLEHLDPDSIYVTRYGADVAPKGDKLVMKKGDVLFGKRRAYQKKVAIAPFDGIFSAHGMVLRPKEDVIDKNFFPMFIKSDYFLDAAIKISVGSLSPTINWRDLKELKFELPSLEEQRKLADVLWAIYDMKDKYKKLISATDELVKSQFIEMIESDSSIPKVCLGDIFEISSGGTPSRKKEEYWDDGKIPWVKISDMKSMYVTETEECITELGLAKSSAKLYGAGTFLISIFATLGEVSILDIDATTNQAIAGLVPKREIDTEYMYIALTQLKDHIIDIGRGAAQNNINLSILKNLEISMPTESIRRKFSIFVNQSDKSKVALQEAIKDLDALSKKIIAENLIPAGEE